MSFFGILSSLIHQFSLKLHRMIAWFNVQILGEVKSAKNGGSNLGQTGQSQTQNQVFYHFLKFGWLVFLEIAQDDSSEQCLVDVKPMKTNFILNFIGCGTMSSRVKIYENKIREYKFWPEIGIFPIFTSLYLQFSLILHKIEAWDNA